MKIFFTLQNNQIFLIALNSGRVGSCSDPQLPVPHRQSGKEILMLTRFWTGLRVRPQRLNAAEEAGFGQLLGTPVATHFSVCTTAESDVTCGGPPWWPLSSTNS